MKQKQWMLMMLAVFVMLITVSFFLSTGNSYAWWYSSGEATMDLKLNYSSTPSTSEQLTSTPSTSEQSTSTPSTSEQLTSTPSTSEQSTSTPSNSDSFINQPSTTPSTTSPATTSPDDYIIPDNTVPLAEPTGTSTDDNNSQSPPTGDNNNVFLWILLGSVTLVLLVNIGIKIKHNT